MKTTKTNNQDQSAIISLMKIPKYQIMCTIVFLTCMDYSKVDPMTRDCHYTDHPSHKISPRPRFQKTIFKNQQPLCALFKYVQDTCIVPMPCIWPPLYVNLLVQRISTVQQNCDCVNSLEEIKLGCSYRIFMHVMMACLSLLTLFPKGHNLSIVVLTMVYLYDISMDINGKPIISWDLSSRVLKPTSGVISYT